MVVLREGGAGGGMGPGPLKRSGPLELGPIKTTRAPGGIVTAGSDMTRRISTACKNARRWPTP